MSKKMAMLIILSVISINTCMATSVSFVARNFISAPLGSALTPDPVVSGTFNYTLDELGFRLNYMDMAINGTSWGSDNVFYNDLLAWRGVYALEGEINGTGMTTRTDDFTLFFSERNGVEEILYSTETTDFFWESVDITTATSPVPVPAAVWFMGTGLLGLAGIKHKKFS